MDRFYTLFVVQEMKVERLRTKNRYNKMIHLRVSPFNLKMTLLMMHYYESQFIGESSTFNVILAHSLSYLYVFF